jgi:hypothetical protein
MGEKKKIGYNTTEERLGLSRTEFNRPTTKGGITIVSGIPYTYEQIDLDLALSGRL